MWLTLAAAAVAAPPLHGLATDPAIGDQTARFMVRTTGQTAGGATGAMRGTAELAVAGRVAAGVQIEAATSAPAPVLGGELRVGLLDPDAPLALAVGARYKRDGFVPGTDELEAVLAFGADVGDWRLYTNFVGGRALAEPEGDVELFLGADRRLGAARVGGEARGRAWVGEEIREGGKRADLVAGGTVGWDKGAWSVMGFAGGVANAFVGGLAQAGAFVRLGAQVAF